MAAIIVTVVLAYFAVSIIALYSKKYTQLEAEGKIKKKKHLGLSMALWIVGFLLFIPVWIGIISYFVPTPEKYGFWGYLLVFGLSIVPFVAILIYAFRSLKKTSIESTSRIKKIKGMNQKLFYIILAIVTIILVGVVSYFLSQKNVPLDTTIKTETTNWKTYRNEEYGFEMKYPPEWEHDYDNPSAPKRENSTHINLIDDRSFSISIQVVPAEIVSSPPYYLRELEISKVALEMFGDPQKYEITNFNGVPAIKDRISSGFTIFHRSPNYQIYIASASRVAEYGNYKTVDQTTLDQIVSTFGFTR